MRLIDADEIINKLNNSDLKECFLTNADGVIRLLEDAPKVDINILVPQSIKAEVMGALQAKARRDEIGVYYAGVNEPTFKADLIEKVLTDIINSKVKAQGVDIEEDKRERGE